MSIQSALAGGAATLLLALAAACSPQSDPEQSTNREAGNARYRDAGKDISQAGSETPAPPESKPDMQTGHQDDPAISGTVRAELIDAREIDALEIKITTTDGVVMLDGTVNSEEERTRAGQIAESVDGVRSVNNRIEVRG